MIIPRGHWKHILLLLLLLLVASCRRNAPHALAKTAALEVYHVSRSSMPNSRAATEPLNGSQVFLSLPPVITSVDVATVQSAHEGNDRSSLSVHLTPAGAQKLAAATTPPAGKELAVLVNGQVTGVFKVVSPLSTSFSMSGGRLGSEGEEIFRALTEE